MKEKNNITFNVLFPNAFKKYEDKITHIRSTTTVT